MNRAFKVALLCGLAMTVASCGTVRQALPFGLGGSDAPTATATEGQRISVLEFEQQLAPSAALSGRDFFIPGPQAATAWTQPGSAALAMSRASGSRSTARITARRSPRTPWPLLAKAPATRAM